MNKPATEIHYAQMAIDANQPQIDASYELLKSGHDYNGLTLDLYGEHDEDGYEVYVVSLAGSTIDLFELIDAKILQHFFPTGATTTCRALRN
ncbi:hypothetical protein ACFS07_10245 [Undibacterium arcticum]